MRKRNREGELIINSARGMQRALLDAGIEVSRATVTEDMRAVGARYLARPTTADLSEHHIEVRKSLATTLLAADPKTIIFTDESLFDCSDTKLRQWVAKGEKPKPRREARWSARAPNTKNFLQERGISVLKWPPRVPIGTPSKTCGGIVKSRVKVNSRLKN